MIALAAALLLLLPAPPDLQKPTAARRQKAQLRITSVSPSPPVFGEPVTITGKGLDRVKAVIVGEFAPEILSQDEGTLVFRAPRIRNMAQYEANLYVVVPGLPIARYPEQVVFAEKPSTASRPMARPDVLLDETLRLSPGKTKRWELESAGASALTLTVEAHGGEVEAQVAPVPARGEPRYRATYGGGLQWSIGPRELMGRGAAMPEKVSISLTSDAPDGIALSVKVVRNAPKG